MRESDKHLLILATNDVQLAFPKLKGHFVHGVVRRNLRTHTQFRVPTIDSLHVDTPWPDLFACGDWIGYPSLALWMERSTVTAIAAANRVLETNNLEPYAIISPKPPEALSIGFGALARGFRWLFRPLIRLEQKRRTR